MERISGFVYALQDMLPQELQSIVFTLLGVALAALLLYWGGTLSHRKLLKMGIPGPPPLPYIGNFWQIAKEGGLHLATLAFMKKYGKVYGYCLGRNPSVVIGDPDLLKQILVKDFDNFRNRFVMFENPSEMKVGLLEAKEDTWKRIRSTLTPTFTSGKLKVMVPLMEKSCDTLVEKLKEIANTGETVDITPLFSRMGLEIILSTAFGYDVDVQRSTHDDEIVLKTRELMEQGTTLRILAMLPFFHVVMSLFIRITQPFKVFLMTAKGIIKQRKKIHNPNSKARDLVDIMLTKKMDEDEMVAQSTTFLFAGHETTSSALSTTAYYLALNPQIQDKLRGEIRAAEKASPDAQPLDLASNLEYLDCVINEALRIRPSIFVVNRECSQAYTINGYTIPAGMEVTIPIYALHHDPDAWPEPDKFDPERFRGPAKESRHPFQFLPFGAGPRNCIGLRFALMEVKLAVFKILSEYKFVRCPETQVPLKTIAGGVLLARDGIKMKVANA